MFELHTQRLRLIPLDACKLRWSLDDPERLENNLELSRGSAVVADEVRGAVEQMLQGVVRDPDNYLWHTHWIIVLKRSRSVAGGLCFKGPPTADGEVEIGFGLGAEYQNRGLMTEALCALCAWGLRQREVSTILAETELANLPSQRVLEKNNFVPLRETETMQWWRLTARSRP